MAEEKYVVAAVRNKMGKSGDMGIVIDNFRKIEFAHHARGRLQDEATKKGVRDIGIFQKGKFIESLWNKLPHTKKPRQLGAFLLLL